MTPIINLDLTGCTEREPGVWTDERGLVLSVHFFSLVPDLPAPLDEPDRLRHAMTHSVAAAGAGLIEAEVGAVDAVPAFRQLLKVPRPQGHGQIFIGSWTIPRATCSTVFKVQAAEGQPTGLRESVVFSRTGLDGYYKPHPYATDVQGGIPYHIADFEEWDGLFPDHALSLVRSALRRITPTLQLDQRFKDLPPFAG
ncbi:hypothetical protein [Streptacidiphilus albus]|uniref:hypothetical protein n=1 Tax=Streptacidiphilus albus TaxID=105425 RepID=UPI00054BFF1A|nr:hypothetical protein [Streptacidiphilus albus]